MGFMKSVKLVDAFRPNACQRSNYNGKSQRPHWCGGNLMVGKCFLVTMRKTCQGFMRLVRNELANTKVLHM
jgi:hypothetical protein